MECKDEAAVERQKLVDDGEVEIEDEQTNVPPTTNAPKSVQTPNSPVLSNRVCFFLIIDSFTFECEKKEFIEFQCRWFTNGGIDTPSLFTFFLFLSSYIDIFKRRNKSYTGFK